jgi:hypothetical protein
MADLRAKINEISNVAVFCRNHLKYLEKAAEEDPEKPITFRSGTIWRSAEYVLKRYGSCKIYFVPIGKNLVEYEATLREVLLNPKRGEAKTEELLRNCLEETHNEGLWEKYGEKVRTLYVIHGCRKIKSPFPFTALKKVSDDQNISKKYGYSYAIVYEY